MEQIQQHEWASVGALNDNYQLCTHCHCRKFIGPEDGDGPEVIIYVKNKAGYDKEPACITRTTGNGKDTSTPTSDI